MAYAQGGLIAASDYNGFVGSNPSSVSNTINTVWGVGNGSAGYGQTALAQSASSTGLVSATQWATLITTLNSALTHQSGAGSGISGTIVAGNQINYLSTLSTSIATAYTNRLNFASNAAVQVGSPQNTIWGSASTSATVSQSFGLRIQFGSGDQARYFFNCGGRLKFSCVGGGATSFTQRTNAVVALLTDLGGVGLFGANTNAGRLGTGGTVTTNNTATGYYNSTYNGNVTLVAVTSTTSSYTTDTASISVSTAGTKGSNNDNGSTVDFWITLTSTSGSNAGGSFDDSFNVNVTRSLDISYPETTNLTNSWGSPLVIAI